ncbi:MAG: mechanosensitive ion channel family protein [Cytophagales bacterium]|nr:mechanosensitive ion channel family protein [Cytophagales bacterium]
MNATTFQTQEVWQFLTTQAPTFALRAALALLVWFVGRWLIRWLVRVLGRALERGKKVDAMLSKYLQSIVHFALNLILVLAILDIFGVSTTSFAALLAGLGLAIGTAWGGLLTHFSAGVFMQVLRPYKIGDVVSVGGVTGVVKDLGLFGTTLVTGDNVVAIMGNNKVFSDTIKNYSALPTRRVECTAKIAHSVDALEAIERLKNALSLIPHVVTDPAPTVDILQFTPEGPLLCLYAYANTEDYWQVYFDIHKMIVNTFKQAGYPVPETPTVQRTV